MPSTKIAPYNYQNSIFSPDLIHKDQITHSGYINFIRLYQYLEKQNQSLKILDFGCGAGAMIASLQKLLPQHDYYGVDISKKAIEYGKDQFKDINLETITSDQIPFSDIAFDIVIISEVLEHVVDYSNTLTKALSLLKQDGTLYLTSPLEASLWTIQGILLKSTNILLSRQTTGHINTFTKKSLYQLILSSNLKVIQKTYSQHFLWQLSMTFYQLLLILLNKNVSLHRPAQNGSRVYSSLNLFGILIKTVSLVTNIESTIFKNLPGSDIQIICKKC